MNLSGKSVSALARFFKIEPSEILVVHDELDLLPGQAKLKLGGSAAGHNGLKDIHAQLGTPDYWRLRLGIGHPGVKSEVIHYVLRKPGAEERTEIDKSIDQALSGIELLLRGDMDKATMKINARPPKPKPEKPPKAEADKAAGPVPGPGAKPLNRGARRERHPSAPARLPCCGCWPDRRAAAGRRCGLPLRRRIRTRPCAEGRVVDAADPVTAARPPTPREPPPPNAAWPSRWCAIGEPTKPPPGPRRDPARLAQGGGSREAPSKKKRKTKKRRAPRPTTISSSACRRRRSRKAEPAEPGRARTAGRSGQ